MKRFQKHPFNDANQIRNKKHRKPDQHGWKLFKKCSNVAAMLSANVTWELLVCQLGFVSNWFGNSIPHWNRKRRNPIRNNEI